MITAQHYLTFLLVDELLDKSRPLLLTFIFASCIPQRFSLLDNDQDGHLTEDDVISVPVDVVDEAFGRTLPGEVRDWKRDSVYL